MVLKIYIIKKKIGILMQFRSKQIHADYKYNYKKKKKIQLFRYPTIRLNYQIFFYLYI